MSLPAFALRVLSPLFALTFCLGAAASTHIPSEADYIRPPVDSIDYDPYKPTPVPPVITLPDGSLPVITPMMRTPESMEWAAWGLRYGMKSADRVYYSTPSEGLEETKRVMRKLFSRNRLAEPSPEEVAFVNAKHVELVKVHMADVNRSYEARGLQPLARKLIF